ncbi:hypothetical protein HAZT_HAZT007063 [Hyalella azteca]|uniref:RING-type domain-containing protein n=1 Tax=Hyalella azteca TaxID=294128 RepID=A0A6A0GY72_HYAAZ|nr:hypothetical protein HAZT_HAZT007063 [Hyalella azteca]
MTGADTDTWGRLGSPISQDWGEGVGLFANPSSQAPQPPKPSKGSAGVNISLGDLNPHFVCVLCFGYFVDATTITECLHTFCRSCIVSFLKEHRHCPHCDTLLLKTRPFSSLRDQVP